MKRPAIYLGFSTAIQIARCINLAELAPTRGTRNTPPKHSPSIKEVENAIACIQETYPALRLDGPVHFLVSGGTRCRGTQAYRPHMCSTQLSNASFLQVEEGVYIATPALAFVQQTPQMGMVSLLELGYELCGSFQTKKTCSTPAYQVAPLASKQGIEDYCNRNRAVNGTRAVLRVMPYLADGSASPRETKQALVLGLPKRYGGGGLGIPHMNYEVRASREARALASKSCFRCDLCWPEAKLDVEYQSREAHEGEASRINDSRRANALIGMGWRIVGITNNELDSLVATDAIIQSIRRILGIHSQTRISDYRARQIRLRLQLGLPIDYEHD